MSIIAKALKEEGLQMQADALPKKQRTVKVFQRLIAAMRAAEAEVQDRLSDSEHSLNLANENRLALQERIRKLEGELLDLRLKDRIGQIPSLTVSDRTKLLEASGVSNGTA